jgi:Mrp family chromosome partitioning ATPase
MYHSMEFFRKVDGVVLVIEAERVRTPVIERAVDTLQDCGANVLGAVLNKRRFPIPRFLYKRL